MTDFLLTAEEARIDCGEKRILAMVILQAMYDYIYPVEYYEEGKKVSRQQCRERALDFFVYTGEEVMTFRWICEALFEDAEGARKRLLLDLLNRRLIVSRPGQKKDVCARGKKFGKVGSGE